MGYEELYATSGVKQASQAELGEGVEAIAEDIPREQEEVKVEKEKVPRVGEWELDQADRKDLEGLLLQDMQDSAADSDDGLCRSPIPFACADCLGLQRQHVGAIADLDSVQDRRVHPRHLLRAIRHCS